MAHVAHECVRRVAECVTMLLVSVCACLNPAIASSVEQGRRLALTHCARCHAIDKVSWSPLSIAPPTRGDRPSHGSGAVAMQPIDHLSLDR
jgi:mono/diheme cytochrome c family protein